MNSELVVWEAEQACAMPDSPPESAVPTVQYDVKLGSLVSYIDVDGLFFANLLQEQGFDDEQIKSVTILITSETAEHGELVLFGGFNPKLNTVIVHAGSAKKEIDELINPPLSEASQAYEIGTFLTEAIAHEISHAIDAVKLGSVALARETITHYNVTPKESLLMRCVKRLAKMKIVAESVEVQEIVRELEYNNIQYAADRAVKKGTFEQYENMPEEIRARSLATQVISSLNEARENPVDIEFR